MNKQNELSEEEFVSFLHSLGVETYKRSFEWMLHDPKFSNVFTWLFNNLNHNNALTKREEYWYGELQKTGQLLSEEDLEANLRSIRQEYPGICVPGDQDALEDVKFNIQQMTEKLSSLEKKEKGLKDLVKQKKQIKQNLKLEVSKLHSTQQQLETEEAEAGKECLALAEEVDQLTEDVISVVANALDVYANCNVDKDLSKKFFTFGPVDAYRQSQVLFRSHFDLYTTRNFDKKIDESISDEDLRSTLVEAKMLEERLSNAAFAYIESKAELSGEQAKLALFNNYTNVHPTQIPCLMAETHSAMELLTQEEAIVEQQIRDAVSQLVKNRTKMTLNSVTAAALDVREQILTDLTHLHETCNEAVCLDRVLYGALKGELRAVEECAQFAADLYEYYQTDVSPVAGRIQAMNSIMSQQDIARRNLDQKDVLLNSLSKILGSNDAVVLNKKYRDLVNAVNGLKVDLKDACKSKEDAVVAMRTSLLPLQNIVYSGSTKKPKTSDRVASSLSHALIEQLEREEQTVNELSGLLVSVKNGDKHNLRKFWQWFLTDPAQLLAAIKH